MCICFLASRIPDDDVVLNRTGYAYEALSGLRSGGKKLAIHRDEVHRRLRSRFWGIYRFYRSASKFYYAEGRSTRHGYEHHPRFLLGWKGYCIPGSF